MTTEQYAIPGLTNVLYIDLTKQSYHIKDRRDLMKVLGRRRGCHEPNARRNM